MTNGPAKLSLYNSPAFDFVCIVFPTRFEEILYPVGEQRHTMKGSPGVTLETPMVTLFRHLSRFVTVFWSDCNRGAEGVTETHIRTLTENYTSAGKFGGIFKFLDGLSSQKNLTVLFGSDEI